MSAERRDEPPPKVLLLCGSPSDLELVIRARETLEELGIGSDIRVVSAHRTPDAAVECARNAESEGYGVIVAFAGLSAALSGVAAAHTVLPVIGVPIDTGPLRGLEAALATLQMPPGTPVAAVAIDGARNAAILAGRILGLGYAGIRERLAELTERDRQRYAPASVEAEILKLTRARKKSERR